MPRRAERVQLVIPAAQVLITRARVPHAARRRAGSVLAFAVEEETLGEPEANQVSWLGSAGDADVLAVVDKQGLTRWLDALDDVGIGAYEVHCETLLLPWAAGEWSLAWDGRDGFVRTGEFEGAATDCGDRQSPPLSLRLALEAAAARNARPDSIAVYTTAPDAALDLETWQRELGVTLRLAGSWDWRTAPPDAGVSLVQARKRWRVLPGALARLRPAAWIVGVALAIQAVALVTDWTLLAREQRALRQQMEARFRAAFPDAVAVVDPALQMRRKLAEARHAAGQPDGGDFLPMIEKVAAALKDLPAGSLRIVSYESGRHDARTRRYRRGGHAPHCGALAASRPERRQGCRNCAGRDAPRKRDGGHHRAGVMRAQLRKLWEARSPRERAVVAAMAAVLGVALFLWLVQSADRARVAVAHERHETAGAGGTPRTAGGRTRAPARRTGPIGVADRSAHAGASPGWCRRTVACAGANRCSGRQPGDGGIRRRGVRRLAGLGRELAIAARPSRRLPHRSLVHAGSGERDGHPHSRQGAVMRWSLLAIGLGAYALALIATAPATLADAGLQGASDGRLRLAEAQGTLWSGTGQIEVRDAGGRSGVAKSLAWRVLPESLLRGRLVCEVGLEQATTRFPVTISFSRIELADADITLPATALGLAVPELAPLQLTGDMKLHVARLVIGRSGIQATRRCNGAPPARRSRPSRPWATTNCASRMKAPRPMPRCAPCRGRSSSTVAGRGR